MQSLISVIIPIYKVEPYLEHCIDSVLKQTYTDLEIILVNDGSPDNCPQICDEYAQKDARIKVIHKENGGLSDARNAGLDICTGDYIFFLDSDDWISKDCIQILEETAKANDYDIIVGNFRKVYQKSDIRDNIHHPQHRELKPAQAIENLIGKNGLTFTTAWGKLYKRYIWKDIRFPKGKLYEDAYVSHLLYARSRTIAFVDAPLYFYLQRSDSILGQTKDPLHAIEPKILLNQFLEKKFPAQQYVSLSMLCWNYLFAYSQTPKNQDYLDNFYSYYKNYQSVNKPLSLQRILLNFFATFPFIYVFYQNKSPFRLRKK